MKKTIAFLTVALLASLSTLSISFAGGEGEQDDSATYCSSVNDQKHEVSEDSSASEQEDSSSSSGKSI